MWRLDSYAKVEDEKSVIVKRAVPILYKKDMEYLKNVIPSND